MDTEQWDEWLGRIRSRDEIALAEFWSNYASRLVRLADMHLQASLRRRVDADDIVQSAIRTFFRRAEDNQFHLGDDQQLWALLCAITLNKTRLAARRHLREKRGVDRETEHDQQPDGASREYAASGPQPEDAVLLVELIESLMDTARDDNERLILQLKLEETPNDEIASRVGCSERTVRRLLQRFRERLESQLGE